MIVRGDPSFVSAFITPMPFKKKLGRPRKYSTEKEAKEVAQRRRTQWENRNQEQRRERRLAHLGRGQSWSQKVISWPGIDCSVRELFDDKCFQYPVPDNTRLATLYRSLKNIHIHIAMSFGGDPDDWLKNSAEVLAQSRGAALEQHLVVMQCVQRTLRPYIRAMEINYDTHAVYLNIDDFWGASAAELYQDVHSWADCLACMMRKHFPYDD
ncbi:hypothetical protein CYLTODRAFT_495039 [Cylindrobasidium torrendii FP15055 ss-10]|uniref:Uncharacterized protein n=1 Tax=Cylindrobasidium torrendii FP15055 ss-10 TaxID=1314674 RepID=A0A0D7AUC9_9AGAR|nr:hypothetical protein CYLTODRAFT_495039 [Cylindrobasidium torrendii FP15055 ss-10]